MKKNVLIILFLVLVFAIGVFVGIKVQDKNISKRLDEYSNEELPDKVIDVIERREKEIAEKEAKALFEKLEYVQITEEITKEEWTAFEEAYNAYFKTNSEIASLSRSGKWNETYNGIDSTRERINNAKDVLIKETPAQLKDRVNKTINIADEFVSNYSQKKYTRETFESAYWDFWYSISNLRSLIQEYSKEYGF